MDRIEKHTTLLSAAVATVITAFFIRSIVSKSRENYTRGAQEIPSPKGNYFYLGHIPHMSKRPGLTVTKWHQELGPIFKIKMGVQTWVFLGEPEVAHEILSVQGGATAGRPQFTFLSKINAPDNRGIAFVDYSKRWKYARSAVLNILSPNTVDGFVDILERETNQVVETMKEHANVYGEIDPHSFSRLSSMNIMLAVAFGIKGSKTVEDPFYKKAMKLLEQTVEFSSMAHDYTTLLPSLKFLDIIFKKEKRMVDFRDQEYHPFIVQLIERALKSSDDSLAKKVDKLKEEYQFDDLSVISFMSEVLAAGIDTTANSISWFFAILCNYPEHQKRIFEELKEFTKKYNRQPLFTDKEELPFLIAFMKEGTRFRPAGHFGLPHKALQDGSILVANLHTLHLDSRCFPDPERFLPERFLGDTRSMDSASKGSFKTRDHFTFGWGRRICPGIYLAENEIFMIITRVLTKFSVEPALSSNGEKLYPDLNDSVDTGITIYPVPYKVRLIER
ncbi:hypothetical protein G6F56_000105 [Rhizopus delemar]|nr:hypothetical protein G6F56_000105 [Rhizopus delemar]